MPYYAGDPGFFSFLKQGLGAVAGMIPGVGGAIQKVITRSAVPRAPISSIASSPLIKRGVGVISKHPVLSAAGAAATVGLAGAGIEHALAGGACPKGHHISHSRHSMGKCVRNRRMRVTNPKALRRALRRAQGFAKLAMRTIHLVHPRKKGKFGGFKHRRRK